MTNKDKILKYVDEISFIEKRKPAYWEIEQATGVTATSIVRILLDYPDELKVTAQDKRILDLIPDHTANEIADMLNMTRVAVDGVIYRLRQKKLLPNPRGFKRVKKPLVDKSKDQRTYIRVKKKTVVHRLREIDISGCGGYIEGSSFVVYKDCEPLKVKLNYEDYEVVG